MKKALFALAVLLSAGLASLPQLARSQAPGQPGKGTPFDLGPGAGGATLKQPWLDTPGAAPAAPTAPATTPSYLQGLLNTPGASGTQLAGSPLTPAQQSSLLPYDTTGINNDILVAPEMGPWMILVISYAGKEGPMRARKMVTELRGNPKYKLPAYVFNYGAEEKRKELERIKLIIAKQREALQQSNLTVEQPYRVSHVRIDEHCGVLVGGYATQEAAAKVLVQIRKLEAPDPRRVDLDMKFVTPEEGSKATLNEVFHVNPFTRAIVVHNPTIKVERPADANKLDIAVLKHMNSEEDYSLLKCKKNYTLAIKQFTVATITAPKSELASAGGFWNSFSFGKKTVENDDAAARNAHELAKGLRGAKYEAYVLHTKFYSLVTIGGFDSVEDPALRSMQNLIETRLNPAMQTIDVMPKPLPMAIPH